jgi:hypothetical protein
MGGFKVRSLRLNAFLALYIGMPKRKSQERDKRPRDGQNELQQKKKLRNNRKAQGREFAISLPSSNRCSPRLLQASSDYSLHIS